MSKQNSKSQLQLLKEILLQEDREDRAILDSKVREIEEDLSVKERLEPKIEPIIEAKIDHLKQEFPGLITEAIKVQIRDAQEEIVDALYPIMGKMIKKFVAREIQVLNEKIEKSLDKYFSLKGFFERIKNWLKGQKTSDLILKDVNDPTIESIFVIEQLSGILIGSYSRYDAGVDKDMVAGMLTAIKSFVSDALNSGKEELEFIEYENHTIHIQNLNKFYVAVTLTGTFSASFKSKLEEKVLSFIESVVSKNKLKDFSQLELEEGILTDSLKEYFDSDGDK